MMRSRITRWALSPRTPQLVAHKLSELTVLAAAAGSLALVASGLPGHLLATVVVAVAA